jgi:hypothetical protein
MDSLAPPQVACARSETRALSSLCGGKGYGRGAEGIGPSHCEEGNGQLGKGFCAKTITYWAAGEAAEEGEGDQDARSNPGKWHFVAGPASGAVPSFWTRRAAPKPRWGYSHEWQRQELSMRRSRSPTL